jgi:hypothetical protein
MDYTGSIILSDSSRHASGSGVSGFSFSIAPADYNYTNSIIYDSTTVAGDQTFLQQQILGTGDLTLILQEWGYFGGYPIDATTWVDVRWMSRWIDPTYIKYSIWYLNYDTSQYSLIGYQYRDPTQENVGSYYAPLQVPSVPGHYQIRWLYLKDNSGSYGIEKIQAFTSMSRGIDGMRDYPYPAGTLPYPYDGITYESPLVMTLPVYEYRNPGETAQFYLQFNGPVLAPLTYIWRFNGNNMVSDGTHIVGADTSSLIINSLLMSDGGIYNCVISNSVVSTYAYLIMDPP